MRFQLAAIVMLLHLSLSVAAVPPMEHLLLPKFAPEWNLTKSTMTQVCFGPSRVPGGHTVLNSSTGAFLRQWGIVALDFESQEGLWAQHHPKDCDTMMLDQAAQMKQIAPETKVWIYRNLVQGYANFKQVRELLEDPNYAGFFIPFGANNSEKLTPRCEFNPRLNKTLCSDLFHTKLGWTEDGHDCGDIIPCGDYVFDHRNASLRKWIVDEWMMGEMGMGNRSAVDGFLIDDWWTIGGGPSEVPDFAQGTGLVAHSAEYADLYGNWSMTTWESLQAVQAVGGYTWSNINCELDPPYYKVDFDVTGVYKCGLTKTNGSPRANSIETAPIWNGRRGNDQEQNETGKLECAAWLREACDDNSVFGKIPTMISFTDANTPRRPHGGDPFPALLQDVARFLLVRNEYSWMGYGWEGCVHTAPPVVKYDRDYGMPLESCSETAAMSGVFTRRYSKASVSVDCNAFVANITMADGSSV